MIRAERDRGAGHGGLHGRSGRTSWHSRSPPSACPHAVSQGRLSPVPEPPTPIFWDKSKIGKTGNESGGWEVYSASKAALAMMMRSFAARHAGVRGPSSSPPDGAAPMRPLVARVAFEASRTPSPAKPREPTSAFSTTGVAPFRGDWQPQRRRRHRDSLALAPGGYAQKSHPFVRALAVNCTNLPPSVWTSARHPCARVPQTHVIRLGSVAFSRAKTTQWTAAMRKDQSLADGWANRSNRPLD